MCGIAGFVDERLTRGEAAALIQRMSHIIWHRGPDDDGTWIGDGVALGMRRLAIIDVAGGHQPISNEDDSVLVVFNGEIYNYRDLRVELERRGHRFGTSSDTEVIVHAYEEYGDACVEHLRGMFAFALWDRPRRRLVAARDRFGKKPFNYYWDGRRLIFGSEIKSLLLAGIPREVNPVALDEYLVYGYVPAPNTAFAGIYKLPAAHVLIYEDGHVSTRRYWDLSFAPTCQDDEAMAIERTSALLEDAVAVRLMSEVPLGAFLSGGIDSSVVVALMSRLMPQPVKTFSIGFEEDDFSELPHARAVARHFHTDHHEFVVRPDLISVLPQLVWAHDEPFADPSMLPTYYVSKLAREHVTVALSGDGGDEVFGGYSRYARELAVERLPMPLRFVLGHTFAALPEGVRGKNRFGSLHLGLGERFAGRNALFSAAARHALYQPEFAAHLGDHNAYTRSVELFQRTSRLDAMAAMQRADTLLYLTDDVLVKVDKASMLNSLETRAPLLDHPLAEYVSSLPSTVRTPQGTLKYLLRRVAADVLPPEILTRGKRGFGIPLTQWLGGELGTYARDVLYAPQARDRGYFNVRSIRTLVGIQGDRLDPAAGRAIWALLCLELWFETYLDSSLAEIEAMSSMPQALRSAG